MSVGVEKSSLFSASMVASGIGDALGFRNGSWEFCRSGAAIHKELAELGGLSNLKICCMYDWSVNVF
jgi:ADP-ribosylarginine hydrolase